MYKSDPVMPFLPDVTDQRMHSFVISRQNTAADTHTAVDHHNRDLTDQKVPHCCVPVRLVEPALIYMHQNKHSVESQNPGFRQISGRIGNTSFCPHGMQKDQIISSGQKIFPDLM